MTKQDELKAAIEQLKSTVSFIDSHNGSAVSKQIQLINSLNRLIKSNLTYSTMAIQDLETHEVFNYKRQAEFDLIKTITQ